MRRTARAQQKGLQIVSSPTLPTPETLECVLSPPVTVQRLTGERGRGDTSVKRMRMDRIYPRSCAMNNTMTYKMTKDRPLNSSEQNNRTEPTHTHTQEIRQKLITLPPLLLLLLLSLLPMQLRSPRQSWDLLLHLHERTVDRQSKLANESQGVGD